jgi:short chain dehydrogenase
LEEHVAKLDPTIDRPHIVQHLVMSPFQSAESYVAQTFKVQFEIRKSSAFSLVTGSTDGVGRVMARRLADQGARVLIHGRARTRGEQLLKEIRGANRGSAVFLPADFSSLAEVRRLADTIRQECDRLDILINNAGIGSGGSAGKRIPVLATQVGRVHAGLVLLQYGNDLFFAMPLALHRLVLP